MAGTTLLVAAPITVDLGRPDETGLTPVVRVSTACAQGETGPCVADPFHSCTTAWMIEVQRGARCVPSSGECS